MSYLRYMCLLGSSWPPVVCRSAHVLFRLYVFVYIYWCAIHIVLCFCFVHLRLVFPMLLVSLDCQFLIAPSVFSNIYILVLIIKKCEKTLMRMQRKTIGIFTSWNVCKNSVNKYQARLFKGFTDIEHAIDFLDHCILATGPKTIIKHAKYVSKIIMEAQAN